MGPQDSNDGESSDERTNRVGRRPVLMALGAGTSLALASQYGSVYGRGATGEHEQDGDGDGDGGGGMQNRQCPPCIDPYSGYLQVSETKNGGGQLGNIDPVATVELRVSDADVVFVEEEGGGTATETQTTPTEMPMTETGTGTSTPTEMTETASTGETPAGTPATETPSSADGEGFPDFYFDPVGIRLRPGDTVEFTVREELHTVTAYHPRFFGSQQRVPEGVPGFTSPPFLEDDSWYYRFDEPGVYDMQCLPHEGLGMVMRAVVVEDDADVPDGYPEPEEGTPAPTPVAQRVLGASELEPQNIVEQESVAWTDLTGVESELPMG